MEERLTNPIPGHWYQSENGVTIYVMAVIYTKKDITDVIVKVNNSRGKIKIQSWNKIKLSHLLK